MYISWTRTEDNGITWEGSKLPFPNREIDQEEFYRLSFLSTYSMPTGVNYESSVILPEGEETGYWTVCYQWYHLHGVAVASRYVDRKDDVPGMWVPSRPDKKEGYGYRVRFFRIGCEHDFVGWTDEDYRKHKVTRHRGDHRFTCAKCGKDHGYASV